MDRWDIQQAALARFAAQGYPATTLRQLADDLGVTPAAFYYHFKTKEELLTSLIEDIVTSDLALMHHVAKTSSRPLDELLYFWVYGMCHLREQALVVERDARYLPEPFRKRVARSFASERRVFAASIEDEYDLAGADLTLATRAVLGLGASVLDWFKPDGPLSEHEVAVAYTRYAHGILEQAERDARNGSSPRRRRARNGSADFSFDETVRLIRAPLPIRAEMLARANVAA
jgi:AcrR family transcriptional regulator